MRQQDEAKTFWLWHRDTLAKTSKNEPNRLPGGLGLQVLTQHLTALSTFDDIAHLVRHVDG